MSCTLRINIPFAIGRCDYYGRGLRRSETPAAKHAYLDALVAEARATCPDIATADDQVTRIVFHNGSLGTVEPERLRGLLRELRSAAPIAEGCKVSAEVDPGLVSTALVGELKMQGLDVLRFHYFTSDEPETERLGRARGDLEMAKTRIVMDSAGFHNFDMQVLVGLRGQTEKTLLKTLRDVALIDGVHHFTLVTPGGGLAAGEDQAAALGKTARAFLVEHGFGAYAPGCFAHEGHELPEAETGGARGAGGSGTCEEACAARLGATAPAAGVPSGSVVSLGPGGLSHLDGLSWQNVDDFDAYVRAHGDSAKLTAWVREDAAEGATGGTTAADATAAAATAAEGAMATATDED